MSYSEALPAQGSTYFTAEHLATFVIKNGAPFTIEEGLSRLRKIEHAGGIWTLNVQIRVVPGSLLILEENTGKELERFGLKSLANVQSVSAGGAYNNLIAFTVVDEQIPEFHIFRCLGRNASDFVAAINSCKAENLTPGNLQGVIRRAPSPMSNYPQSLTNLQTSDIVRGKEMLRESKRYPLVPQPENPSNITDPTERKVKLLDCLFSDIEVFVTQLQKVVEAYNHLMKRRTTRENGHGDGLLSLRSKIPPGKDFRDILQKFKLSFILIEALKEKITNPNGPELIHFLFKPLGFVIRVISGHDLEKLELVRSVDNPLINEQVREMFRNCLTTAENDLYEKLGEAWNKTSKEYYEQLPVYVPVFQDGWSPPLEWMREIFGSPCPIYSPYCGVVVEPHNPNLQKFLTQNEFLRSLQLRNAKYATVLCNREAANPKELTVKSGEIVEVLDDSKNWWKVKNSNGEAGFVGKKILQLP